jgi:hypothetical protein
MKQQYQHLFSVYFNVKIWVILNICCPRVSSAIISSCQGVNTGSFSFTKKKKHWAYVM